MGWEQAQRPRDNVITVKEKKKKTKKRKKTRKEARKKDGRKEYSVLFDFPRKSNQRKTEEGEEEENSISDTLPDQKPVLGAVLN